MPDERQAHEGVQMTAQEIAGAPFAAIGVAIMARSAWNLAKAIRSGRWQAVEGVVVKSETQLSRDTDGGLLSRARVSYRYTVGAQDFVAARTRFGDEFPFGRAAPAVAITHKYTAGSPVLVYYNPENPHEAVLEPGITGRAFAGLLFGSVFAFIAAALVFAAA